MVYVLARKYKLERIVDLSKVATMELLEGKGKAKIGLLSPSGEMLGYIEFKKDNLKKVLRQLTQLIEVSKNVIDPRIFTVSENGEFVDFESVKEISEKEEKAVLREASDVVI